MKPRSFRHSAEVRKDDAALIGPIFHGNCGRSITAECGLTNPIECVTHGPLLIAEEEGASPAAKQAQLHQLRREIDREYERAMTDPANRAAARRLRALEARIGDSLDQVRSDVACERRRGHTPSMVAHIASARLMRF